MRSRTILRLSRSASVSSNPLMASTTEKPMATDDRRAPRAYPANALLVLAIGALVGLLYVPLLHWLGSTTLHTQQLLNGALLVLFALAICVRDAMGMLRLAPQISNRGISLIAHANRQ